MPTRTALSNLSGDRVHFGAIRLRVNGSGNLKSSFASLDSVRTQQLADFALMNTTDIEPVILANFTQQRASLTLQLTGLGDWFFLTKITVFVKQVATSIPQ